MPVACKTAHRLAQGTAANAYDGRARMQVAADIIAERGRSTDGIVAECDQWPGTANSAGDCPRTDIGWRKRIVIAGRSRSMSRAARDRLERSCAAQHFRKARAGLIVIVKTVAEADNDAFSACISSP